MKRCALVIFLLPIVAFATEDTKRALVVQLLDVIQAKATLEAMRVQNVELVRRNIESQKGPNADSPIMKRLNARVMEKYEAYSHELLGWDRWEPTYITLYSDNFTEPQIVELIAFYRSDAGNALIHASPVISSRLQQHMVHESQGIQDRVKQIMSEASDEIKAELMKEQANQLPNSTSKSAMPPSGAGAATYSSGMH